jgi:hypothetical protein
MSTSRTIHALVARIGMPDEDYRALLWDRYKASSSKGLTAAQAGDLVICLHGLLPEADRVAHPHPRDAAGTRKRWEHLAGRDEEWATPAQLRMLEAAWVQRSRAETLRAKQDAFKEFVRSRFNRATPSWIQREDVGRILLAIGNVRPDSTPRPRRTKKTTSTPIQPIAQGA